MKVNPPHAIQHLLWFSDLSYPSLWPIWNSDQKTTSGSFYRISTGALCIIGFQPSQQAHVLRLAVAPPSICRCFPLEKQWTLPALCSTRAEAGQTSKHHHCGRKGKPTASIQRARCLVPTILCLHSDFCVQLAFLCFSSKSWSRSNICRYCCVVSGMQLA